MPFATLALFLIAVAGAWGGVLVVFMARQLVRPRRMTDVRALTRVGRMTPTDLGLSFVPMGFAVRDPRSGRPLRLAAWWIPAAQPAERTVVIVHGYADAKIGGIAWAPTWHALGWHVLAVDLRAHGESEGVCSTAGFFERDDLDQLLHALRAEKPASTATVALFGVSLGAACVLATAVRRDDIAAVVLDSPFADYRQAVRGHMLRSGFPLVRASGAVCRVAEWLSGADFDAVRPAALMPTLAAPLMVIVGDADVMIDHAAVRTATLSRGGGQVTRFVVAPGVPHLMALAADPDGYRERLRVFLDHPAAAPPAATPAEPGPIRQESA